jgi:hypothetical protein
VQFQVKIRDDVVKKFKFYIQLGSTTIEINELTPNMRFDDWILIQVVNYERNTPVMSVYVGNVLVETRLPEPNPMNIRISAPIKDPSNYTSNAVYTLDTTDTSYELVNYHNSIYVQEFQLFVSAFSQDETTTTEIHNVVTGKEIDVKGINNICIGNQFKTSGENSIIIGNSIGTNGVSLASSVNDIYQCIVIGNNSYSNSIIRDVISIGNNILQDLSTVADNTKLQDFLTKKPIIIGNDIDSSKIDFNVNIANTFLKTEVTAKQIYLGLDQEVVGIGFASNVNLDPSYGLTVNSTIRAPAIETVATFSAVSPTPISLYKCVSSLGTFDNGLLCVQQSAIHADAAVCGVCVGSRPMADKYKITVAFGGCVSVYSASPTTVGDLLVTSASQGCGQPATTQNYHLAFGKALTATSSNVNMVKCLLRV